VPLFRPQLLHRNLFFLCNVFGTRAAVHNSSTESKRLESQVISLCYFFSLGSLEFVRISIEALEKRSHVSIEALTGKHLSANYCDMSGYLKLPLSRIVLATYLSQDRLLFFFC
jgi:hypothetical protein